MIGFVGQMGSGKTTAADYLVKEYGFRKMSFAEPIKTFIEYILEFEKSNPGYRKAAQDLGTWGRNFKPDCWVNFMEKRLLEEEIVVDDIRFINEAKMLHKNGFKLIKLECPLELRMERCLKRDGNFDKNATNHNSEKELESIVCSKKINNSDTLERFYEELDILMFKENWNDIEGF